MKCLVLFLVLLVIVLSLTQEFKPQNARWFHWEIPPPQNDPTCQNRGFPQNPWQRVKMHQIILPPPSSNNVGWRNNQTVFTVSSDGVTLLLSDSIGIVTPIKPKPLSASTVPSSATSSSLVCDDKDIISKLFPLTPKGSVISEFSSPLALTSSSRALPVPKIDSVSVENVKISERLKEKYLSVCKAPVREIKPDFRLPDVSLPYKYPFLSSSTKLLNASPTNFLADMCSLNKLSPLPTIKLLPNVPLKSLKTSGNDLLRSLSKTNQFSASPSITASPESRSFDPLSTSEAKKPLFGENILTNSFSPLSSSCSSSQYPLHYKSMHLPAVRTSSESLIYKPISYKIAGNFNLPSLPSSNCLFGPKTLDSNTGLNTVPHINGPYASPNLNSIRISEVLKPINPIQLPKTLSNVPVSTKTVSSSLHFKDLLPKDANHGSASVAFESKLEPSMAKLSSLNLSSNENPFQFMPNIRDDRTFKLKPCASLKIKPTSFTSPPNILNLPASPPVPLSPISPTVDVLSRRISNFDNSKYIDSPNTIRVIGTYAENIARSNANDLGSNFQTCFDSKKDLSLETINLPSRTKEFVSIPLKYSPPVIASEPITTISSGLPSFSPTPYSPQTSTTPVSYTKQSPSSSIAKTTSKIVSSITNLVSNIVQNILSSYKFYNHTMPQNIPIIPTYTIPSNPHADTVIKSVETSFIPLLQGNPVNTISILPTITVPTDCIDTPTLDSSAIVSLDAPYHLPASETSSNTPALSSAPQPTASILPPSPIFTSPSPQICPSYLPSPMLPSYSAIASPFFMEAPVYRVKSSKKGSNVEKMLELMLLDEILNNDESFDWDDLDTLLAFLSLS